MEVDCPLVVISSNPTFSQRWFRWAAEVCYPLIGLDQWKVEYKLFLTEIEEPFSKSDIVQCVPSSAKTQIVGYFD